jgi:hypothetical protein
LRIDKLRAVGMDEIRRGVARRAREDECDEKRNDAAAEKTQFHRFTKTKARRGVVPEDYQAGCPGKILN